MMIIHTMKFTACLAVLLVCASAMHEIKDVIRQDVCASSSMELLKPEIEDVTARLKKNPQDLKAKTELLALVEKVRAIYNKCNLAAKVDPMVGDAVEATGVAFLLGSNCFKDVGIVLLLADTIVQDPKDWTNDTIVLIFLYILGRQGLGDCSQFYNFIL